MTDQISRRDFLKLAGAGAAVATVLTGCGPASRYVTREQYTAMPEYAFNGQSTYFATTCRECAAGCGLVVRTFQGRALKVEGNKWNPVNLGKTCARGQATIHGMYNPDRVQKPIKQARGAVLNDQEMTWDSAVNVVADALKNTKPEETAFLLGLSPDHLFDFFAQFAKSSGAKAPVRFGALSMFEARATLRAASKNVFGRADLPSFDIANADVTFSFGANFLETWLSPVANTRGFSKMRQGRSGRRGFLVQFEPRMSQTAVTADEWIPIMPGTEGIVALAIGKLAAELRGIATTAFDNVNPIVAAAAAGVSMETLERFARIFANAERPLAIPGGAALGASNGLQAAEAVLTLNALAGESSGVFFNPSVPVKTGDDRAATAAEMGTLIKMMNDGLIKTLFIHGVNPIFELPQSLGFAEALKNVPQIISFATFPDETALMADYIFPDHQGLEAWGYQRIATGADRMMLSGAQPTVTPFYNTKATIDVFLAAILQIGGKPTADLPFKDEVEFIQDQLVKLVGQGGLFNAAEVITFHSQFQQMGGWWQNDPDQQAPDAASALNRKLQADQAKYEGKGEFFFIPFVSPTLGEAGANKPWLQELPDPTTTVMWNTWVEINPKTAEELGVANDDIVKISSAAGKIEAVVYVYPAIRPDTIAIPFGQGHTAYGRYAAGRGANPADVLGVTFNEAGDLAFAATKVKVEKTGRTKPLSRIEGQVGVYGLDE
jgi:anaerobic selenocysteine-containing dehydrogenase